MNWSENALGLHNYNYLHLSENSIRFHLHVVVTIDEVIRLFVRHVISPFHPNFDRKETRTTQWTLNSAFLLNGFNSMYTCMSIQNLDLWHTLQKSQFLCDYWTKLDGVCTEMLIISYSHIFLKHIQVNSQFWKLLMLKVQLYLFLTISIFLIVFGHVLSTHL